MQLVIKDIEEHPVATNNFLTIKIFMTMAYIDTMEGNEIRKKKKFDNVVHLKCENLQR